MINEAEVNPVYKRTVPTPKGEKTIIVHPFNSRLCGSLCRGLTILSRPEGNEFTCGFFATELTSYTKPTKPLLLVSRCPACVEAEPPFPSVSKIENDEDLEHALLRFDQLFGVQPSDPRYSEYMFLSDLIHAYENKK